MRRRVPCSTLFPYTTLFRSLESTGANSVAAWDNFKNNAGKRIIVVGGDFTKDSSDFKNCYVSDDGGKSWKRDRKSTRLNSSHIVNSYAVFCLKKKRNEENSY